MILLGKNVGSIEGLGLYGRHSRHLVSIYGRLPGICLYINLARIGNRQQEVGELFMDTLETALA
jgi:hypothetical protein